VRKFALPDASTDLYKVYVMYYLGRKLCKSPRHAFPGLIVCLILTF